MEIANATRQARPSGRLRSLLVGRPQRNYSGSESGPCLGGSSGRGIGATAPARPPHPLPPSSRLRLDPPRLKRPPVGGYSGRKPTCRQIGSFARARELLRQGHTYLDRNGDGVACESLR
jgi:hypothetical protein